jgi:hypothetical protein
VSDELMLDLARRAKVAIDSKEPLVVTQQEYDALHRTEIQDWDDAVCAAWQEAGAMLIPGTLSVMVKVKPLWSR